jgi:hypothetical protein
MERELIASEFIYVHPQMPEFKTEQETRGQYSSFAMK